MGRGQLPQQSNRLVPVVVNIILNRGAGPRLVVAEMARQADVGEDQHPSGAGRHIVNQPLHHCGGEEGRRVSGANFHTLAGPAAAAPLVRMIIMDVCHSALQNRPRIGASKPAIGWVVLAGIILLCGPIGKWSGFSR